MNTTTTHKNGHVTAYGFVCGYVQKVETEKLSKEMYREHGVYHVRSSCHNTPSLNTQFDGRTSHAFTIWESFETLKVARSFYIKIK